MRYRYHYFQILLYVVMPVLAGITIYMLWRGISLLHTVPLLTSKPPEWIIYNLPDGLWLYAFLSSIVLLWEGVSSKNLVAWLFTAILLSFLSEILQAFHLIPGTFDFKDLLTYFIASTVTIIQFKNSIKLSLLTFKPLKNENS